MTIGAKQAIKLCHLDFGEIVKRFICKLSRISPIVIMTSLQFIDFE